MRICYIAGAGSVHTQRWVKHFANSGDDVHLITDAAAGVHDLHGVTLHELSLRDLRIPIVSYGVNLLLNLAQVKKLLREIRPDLIHAHYIMSWGFLALLSGFHPFVLTVWGSDVLIDPQRYPILKPLMKNALRRADLITCDAQHMMETMIRLGAREEKISTINFGVDMLKFAPGPRNDIIKSRLRIAGHPTVVSLRSLRPIYDVETLIRAIPLVAHKVPEARFVIAGDGEQRAYLEKLARSQGVLESVRFVGWIPSSELPEYLNSADVYVSTALSDAGLAGSTAEAMACGLPVIVTEFGDNGRWVEDGVNGFLVPPQNSKALASKIVHLLLNTGDRMKFGAANRQIIETRNNREKEMEKVRRLYERIIQQRRIAKY